MLGIGSLIYWAKEGGYTFPEKNVENVVVSYPETKIEITQNDKYIYGYFRVKRLRKCTSLVRDRTCVISSSCSVFTRRPMTGRERERERESNLLPCDDQR